MPTIQFNFKLMKPENIKPSGNDTNLWNPSLLMGRKKEFFAILVENGIDSSKLNKNIIDDLFDIACEKKTYNADDLRKKSTIKRNKYLKDNAGKISVSINKFKAAKSVANQTLTSVIPQNIPTVNIQIPNNIEHCENLANILAMKATQKQLSEMSNDCRQRIARGEEINMNTHLAFYKLCIKANENILTWKDVDNFFQPFNSEPYVKVQSTLQSLKETFLKADINLVKGLLQVMYEEIFLPSKFYSYFQDPDSLYKSVIPEEPQIFITPDGNKIPIHTIYPIEGKLLRAEALSRNIVYPIERDYYNNLFIKDIISSYNLENKIERGSFVHESNKLMNWVILELISSCKDPIDVIRKDTYVEEFEHSDALILSEQRFGRRIYSKYPGEITNEAKSILKPNSPFLKKLLEITNIAQQDVFAESITEIRGKIAALKRSPFPPLAFMDCAGYKLMQSLKVNDKEYYDIARIESLKLLSPHIIGYNGEDINFEKWYKYLDSRLRFHIKGHSDEMSAEVKQFNADLKLASDAILEEHFYLK